MPNWCYTTLHVSGEPKQLNKFLKEVERTDKEANDHYEASKFAFNRVIPMPDELLYQGDSWYTWRNNNWNTKWECAIDYETTDQWESGSVMFDLRTAWSAPMPIMEAVAKKYPKLLFQWKFYEESYAFWGSVFSEKGKLKENYVGEFRGCEDYSQFGLTHHECYRCENYYECEEIVEVGDEHQICWSCKDQEIEADKELWNTLTTEGEANGNKALSS